MPTAPEFAYHPLTPERWSDFAALFGKNGACSGCWCMWWRQTRAEFERRNGEPNRKAMRNLVDGGEVPGIVGYMNGEPVGWCSVSPREKYASLERSRVLARLDDEPVWSLVCLFVRRDRRGRGLARHMVEAAVEFAESRGATIVEAYPVEPRGRRLQAVSSFMGTPALFAAAGFVESARPSKSRVVMRHYHRGRKR